MLSTEQPFARHLFSLLANPRLSGAGFPFSTAGSYQVQPPQTGVSVPGDDDVIVHADAQ